MGDAVHGRPLYFRERTPMNRLTGSLNVTVLVTCLLAWPGRAALAQVGTGIDLGTVTLNAVASPTLHIAVTSGAAQSIASITDGVVNSFPAPVQILSEWNLQPGQVAGFAVVAYFTNPAQAMVNGANVIPSSWIRGRVTTGTPTAFTPITQNAVAGRTGSVGTAGGSLLLFTQAISGKNKSGTRTDNLDLQLDLTGRQAMPGTYTGTLHIRAIVQ